MTNIIMMNKLKTGLSLFLLIALSSCGGMDMCSCAEEGMKVMDEMKEANGDNEKIKEIVERNSANREICKGIAEEFEKTMKDKYESKADAIKGELGDCEAYKKMTTN